MAKFKDYSDQRFGRLVAQQTTLLFDHLIGGSE